MGPTSSLGSMIRFQERGSQDGRLVYLLPLVYSKCRFFFFFLTEFKVEMMITSLLTFQDETQNQKFLRPLLS